MKAVRTWVAVGALVLAVLACDLPGNRNPAQPPDLAGTITAQAVVLLESSDTPTFASMPAANSTLPATPTATPASTPAVPELSVASATDCRTGPGTAYDLVITLSPGQTVQIVGKYTPLHDWIIRIPGGGTCWLWGRYAVVSGNVAVLPDYAPPPSPTPSLPAAPSGLKANFQCTLNSGPFLHNDVHVTLSWEDNAAEANGYYVYRDSTRLATLGPHQTSYSDDTTMAAHIIPGSPPPYITYSVQAFNDAGTSGKVSKAISCFG